MNFLSVLYAKAGITVDGVTTLNNTATALTPTTSDNSTNIATTAFVKNQNYYPYPTGTTSQYVRGDGSLATFSQGGGGGGSSVNYYLNGSVSQGTIGGNTYYEMSKTAIIGTNADFSINADGYVAQFVTDAGDPALLNIPGGNWNFEMFFSASSGGGTPSFYVELYKYDGTTLTLIASGSTAPESITGGTATDLYITALAIPTTTLTLTDRLAVRVYVNHSGRTITLHTQNGHLCQVITTFTTGLTALNGLTAQVQNFAVGTSGSDFAISSVTDTHTFNLPTASATKRGALSSIDWAAFDAKVDFGDLSATAPLNYNGSGLFTIAQSSTSTNGYLSSTDWNTFNNKQNALTNPVTGTGTANYITKWVSGSAVGNSIIYDNGTSVGIGTTSPYGRLQVNNGTDLNVAINTVANDATTVSRISSLNDAATLSMPLVINGSRLVLTTDAVERMRITDGGNIGINITNPSSKLHISTTASNPFRMVRTGGSATDFGFEIGSGDVGFYNYSSSTYGWYLTSASRFGLGTTNPQTKLEVYGGHSDTTARLYSTGNNAGSDASLDMWASEPGVSYDGSGIGNNVNGHPFYGRRNSALGQSYIRFYLGEIILYTGATNANIALTLATSGVATFKNNIILNSAGSDRFTVTTDGVVNWNPSGIGGFLTWDTGKAIVGANNSYALSFYTGGSERLIISGTTGAATFSSSVTASSLIKSGGTSSQYLMADGSTSTLTNPITGTGTTNYIPKFTGASALGNSNLINDANGQLGLGVTPSAWSSTLVRAIQVGNLGASISSYTALNTGTPYMFVDNNAYYDGTDIKYILDRAAARYVQVSNEHRWLNAPTGTAGDTISFTQAMTLDASGRLGIGTTSPTALLTLNSTTPFIRIERAGVPTWQIQNNTLVSTAGFSINNITNATTPFFINGTNDNVGIGTAAPASKLNVLGAGTTAISISNTNAGTNATPELTQLNFLGFQQENRGRIEATDIAGSANGSQLRFYNANSSNTLAENMRIASSGNVLIGTTTDLGFKLNINGDARLSAGLYFNANTYTGANITIKETVSFPAAIAILNRNSTQTWGFAVDTSVVNDANFGLYNITAGSFPMVVAPSGATTFSSSITAIIGNFFQTADSGFAINMKNRNANQTWSMVVDTDAVDDKIFGIYSSTSSTFPLKLNATTGAATFSSSVTATNFIVPGGTSAQFLKADGSLDSNVYLTATSSTFSYTASVTLSPTWQNTGVSSLNLGSGAYLVTCNVDDYAVGGGQYNCTYTGIMYFYAGGTNGSNANEIVLHHSGHADQGRYIYLRTLGTLTADGKTYLQISGNGTNSAASNYQLTFKKLL